MDKLPLPEGNSQETKVRRILFNEVNLILAVISIVGVIYAVFFGSSYKLQKQIDELNYKVETEQQLSAQMQNIKDNDLHTLSENQKEIKNNVNEVIKELVKLQTIIEERLPVK